MTKKPLLYLYRRTSCTTKRWGVRTSSRACSRGGVSMQPWSSSSVSRLLAESPRAAASALVKKASSRLMHTNGPGCPGCPGAPTGKLSPWSEILGRHFFLAAGGIDPGGTCCTKLRQAPASNGPHPPPICPTCSSLDNRNAQAVWLVGTLKRFHASRTGQGAMHPPAAPGLTSAHQPNNGSKN